MRGLREDRRALGASANVSGMRWHEVLRRLAEPSCQQTLPVELASRHRIGRAGRAVALLLPGRRLHGVLRRRDEPPRGPSRTRREALLMSRSPDPRYRLMWTSRHGTTTRSE